MTMIKIIKESNFTQDNLIRHLESHKVHYLNDPRFANVTTDEEFSALYDSIGDALSRKRVSKSNSSDRYVGYITKNGRRIKYDRKTLDWISYNRDITITLHKKSAKEYERIKKRDYLKEFPYNQK